MRRSDFIRIAEDLQARWWAFPIPPSALDSYAADLSDLDVDLVSTAVAALDATGEFRQPPTSGQIRRKAAELQLDAPDWDAARTAIVRWRRGSERRAEAMKSWKCPEGICDGSSYLQVAERTLRPCMCRPAYVAALRGWDTLSPLIVEFLREGHADPGVMMQMLDTFDTTAEAQLRSRWREFTSRAVQSRTLAGLQAAADVPQITAARAEDEQRRGARGLDKINVTALIGAGS